MSLTSLIAKRLAERNNQRGMNLSSKTHRIEGFQSMERPQLLQGWKQVDQILYLMTLLERPRSTAGTLHGQIRGSTHSDYSQSASYFHGFCESLLSTAPSLEDSREEEKGRRKGSGLRRPEWIYCESNVVRGGQRGYPVDHGQLVPRVQITAKLVPSSCMATVDFIGLRTRVVRLCAFLLLLLFPLLKARRAPNTTATTAKPTSLHTFHTVTRIPDQVSCGAT